MPADVLEVDGVDPPLEPELMEHSDMQTHSDKHNEHRNSDSDSSQSSEVSRCLDAFEEIVEESELERFSAYLMDAQKAALELEKTKGKARKPYTGHSRTTQYRQKKFGADPASKGFLGVDVYTTRMALKKKPAIGYEEEEESSSDDSGAHPGCGDCAQGGVSDCNSSDLEGPLPDSVAQSERAPSCSRTPIDLAML